ncbi:hypothetical protein M422DRAFT_273772, partial [Sphaerobolus stellatus SS14]
MPPRRREREEATPYIPPHSLVGNSPARPVIPSPLYDPPPHLGGGPQATSYRRSPNVRVMPM